MPTIAPLAEGPLDIVGDIHGEYDVLCGLLEHLGYRPDGHHPEGRRLVFLGDLCDRGHDSPAVIELVRRLVEARAAQCILGNHELNLLRRDAKHGNRWYLDPDHPEMKGEFKHCKRATDDAQKARWHAFFLSLPLALERDDLRVVHAAWDARSIEVLRGTTGTTLELFAHHDRETQALLEAEGIADAARHEKQTHAAALVDPSRPLPLLANLARRDELLQTNNPVRVLTSGPERVTEEPFYANGKWRMCDRVRWWNEYTDGVPVVFGHYWRKAGGDTDHALSGGKPDLFAEHPPHAWIGSRRNVFCVDFSIGGRYRELARGATSFQTRLAAVRWPERVLRFDDGTTHEME